MCSYASRSGENGAFEIWEVVGGLSSGEYGLGFRKGSVEGYAVQMVTIYLSCAAGTHAISVETMSYADSYSMTIEPLATYATSVGRAAGYATAAQVLVKAETEDVHVFAYASDGRANLNNLASIGHAAPKPTTSECGSVPDRMPRSCPPPEKIGSRRTRGRRRTYSAPMPFGP